MITNFKIFESFGTDYGIKSYIDFISTNNIHQKSEKLGDIIDGMKKLQDEIYIKLTMKKYNL